KDETQERMMEIAAKSDDQLDDFARRIDAGFIADQLNTLSPYFVIYLGPPFPPTVRQMLDELDYELSMPPDSDRKHKLARTNRLPWEAGLTGMVKKLESRGWRPAIVTIGLSGVAVALAFLVLFRNDPATHPACNAAERTHIQTDPSVGVGLPLPVDHV